MAAEEGLGGSECGVWHRLNSLEPERRDDYPTTLPAGEPPNRWAASAALLRGARACDGGCRHIADDSIRVGDFVSSRLALPSASSTAGLVICHPFLSFYTLK